MCGLSAYILTYTYNTGTRSSFIYEFSSVSLFFFFLSFLNSILIFFFSFFFDERIRTLARVHEGTHYNFEKCFSKYVSREINDRSSLTRSIDKIFFLPGLSWTGNKVTLFLKHLCLLFFFALPTFTRARDHGQRYRLGLYWFEKWETTRWKDRKRH